MPVFYPSQILFRAGLFHAESDSCISKPETRAGHLLPREVLPCAGVPANLIRKLMLPECIGDSFFRILISIQSVEQERHNEVRP